MTRATSLVAPVVVFIAIVGLLIGARTYESWPIKPRECNFKVLSGYPCISCGGTRSFMALSRGEFSTAFAFNPLAVISVFFVTAWLIFSLVRKPKEGPPLTHKQQRRKNWIIVSIVASALIINWIYLVLYLE